MSAREDQVHEESLWFGNDDSPLFGRLTSPTARSARGGVLISPPIGREARLARRALRTLAFELAMDGYVALRFDHFATGDSSGSFDVDEDFIRIWIEGVNQGVALLRSLGVSSVSAVGMRMGATILGAAQADSNLALDSAVLWDPCESGRSYLRESSALGSLGRDVAAPEEGEPVKMLEFVYSQETAKRLSEISLLTVTPGPLAERVLVIARDDRVVSTKMRDRWSENVEWVPTNEQAQLLETELPLSVQPVVTTAMIREWLTSAGSLATPLQDNHRVSDNVVVSGVNSHLVRERFVQLGPQKLFGVLSEPTGEVRGPLIVMVSGFNEDHTGPSRLWVELSRLWAGFGLRCVRFDFQELGESPWLPSSPAPSVFTKTLNDDIQDVIKQLSPESTADSVLIGLCSGAKLALEVALDFKSRGACMINPQVGTGLLRNAHRMEKSERHLIQAFKQRSENILKRHRWVGQTVRQISRLVFPNATSPKVRSTLKENGTEMLLLASLGDFSPFPWMPIVGSIDRRRLVSSPHFRVEVVPGMDHDFLADLPRARAVAILKHHVLEKFAEAALPPDP
jgi:pimeloyl-ACP methyl ester carboxylesterase